MHLIKAGSIETMPSLDISESIKPDAKWEIIIICTFHFYSRIESLETGKFPCNGRLSNGMFFPVAKRKDGEH
jgi:hypothetical protein